MEKINTIEGHWILSKIKDDVWGGWWYRYTCSKCSHTMPHVEPHCPACGIPMDGIIEDEHG